jgi:UDP-N-acetyl-D-mannosaminuronic acid dehydrogenase
LQNICRRTFKADIDDLRESPALAIVARLLSSHAGKVLVVEPNIYVLPSLLEGAVLVSSDIAFDQADIAVLLVDHHVFKGVRPPERMRVVDARGLWT